MRKGQNHDGLPKGIIQKLESLCNVVQHSNDYAVSQPHHSEYVRCHNGINRIVLHDNLFAGSTL